MKYSILEIAEILGADASHLNNASIDTLLTDSRTLTYPDRSLFFALHTDSNDGHRYVHQLYEKGVRNFVVEHIPEGVPTGDANFIVVKKFHKGAPATRLVPPPPLSHPDDRSDGQPRKDSGEGMAVSVAAPRLQYRA